MTSIGEIVLIDSRHDSMIITWPEKSDAVRYCLEYRECTDNDDEDSFDSQAEYENTYTFLSNKLTGVQCSKRNLKPSTEYKFRVAACYSDGRKQGSWVGHTEPFATLSEEDEEYSMAAPLVTMTADYNTLLITWEEIEDEEFYGFDLQMRENKGGSKWYQAFDDIIDDSDGGNNEITRGDLKSRRGYQFRVRPITEHEEPFSQPSDPVVPRLKPTYDGSNQKQQKQNQNQQYESQPQYYPKPQQKTKSSTSDQDNYDNNDIEDESWNYSKDGRREQYESPNQQAAQVQQRETQYGYQDPNAMPAPWFKSTGGNDQSVIVCWQPQDGTSAYELQMKELSTTHVVGELDTSWTTIAAHFMNTQVKKKNLTSSYGYQFRVKPLDGYMSERGYSNPSNPIILPTSSRTKKQNHQRAKAEFAPMPAPWFKGVGGSGERNAIIVCWQPQSGSTSYELQMRENSQGEVWATIASNLKCTEVKKKNLISSNGYQFRIKPNDGPKKHRGFSPPSSTAIAN